MFRLKATLQTHLDAILACTKENEALDTVDVPRMSGTALYNFAVTGRKKETSYYS